MTAGLAESHRQDREVADVDEITIVGIPRQQHANMDRMTAVRHDEIERRRQRQCVLDADAVIARRQAVHHELPVAIPVVSAVKDHDIIAHTGDAHLQG